MELLKQSVFASVVSGVNGRDHKKKENVLKTIKIDEADLLFVLDAACVVLSKVRDMNIIFNLESVLLKEGFCDVKLYYIGGLWMWLEFRSKKSMHWIQTTWRN